MMSRVDFKAIKFGVLLFHHRTWSRFGSHRKLFYCHNQAHTLGFLLSWGVFPSSSYGRNSLPWFTIYIFFSFFIRELPRETLFSSSIPSKQNETKEKRRNTHNRRMINGILLEYSCTYFELARGERENQLKRFRFFSVSFETETRRGECWNLFAEPKRRCEHCFSFNFKSQPDGGTTSPISQDDCFFTLFA